MLSDAIRGADGQSVGLGKSVSFQPGPSFGTAKLHLPPAEETLLSLTRKGLHVLDVERTASVQLHSGCSCYISCVRGRGVYFRLIETPDASESGSLHAK